MSKKILRSIILILVLTLITPSITRAEAQIYYNDGEPKVDILFLEEVLEIIKDNYPFDVQEDKLLEAAIKGMLKSLDSYSDYYTKEEADAKFAPLFGTFSGIGIYIEEKDGYISVVGTIKGQPAEKAGVKSGDLIISVDDVDIKNMGIDKGSSLIKGPKGTKVKIGIKRGDKLLTFEIVRDTIQVNPVYSEILENNIGYIQFDDFNAYTTVEVKKVLAEFDKKKVTKVILDLRNNGGGLFDQAISIGELFVPAGPIVYVRDKSNSLKVHRSTLKNQKYKLVVLVNEYSASASEIVAGAIKDTKAGTLVGTKTFGKGIIQTLMTVTDGSIVKLTTGEYLTPNKTSIHGKGIEPNIVIENTEKEDLQLKKAIELLK